MQMIIDPRNIKMEDIIQVNEIAKRAIVEASEARRLDVLERIARKLNETFGTEERKEGFI